MPSFDVVSEVNLQEVKNAVDQVSREIATRYDFRASKSTITLNETTIILVADDKMKLAALQEILRLKLSKRGVSLKSVEFKDAAAAGGDTLRQEIIIKQGLKDEELKRVTKLIKQMKQKVSAQIQDAQVRVSGKKRDELQEVITALKKEITDIELQFTNFRE